MARMIQFCPRQLYEGVAGSTAQYSEIFEVTDVGKLDVELRVFGTTDTGVGAALTGEVEQTSDSTFQDASWKRNGAQLILASSGVTGTSLSGLGRFVRGKLTVSGGVRVTACLNAVAREP